jgi:hypothetical protein
MTLRSGKAGFSIVVCALSLSLSNTETEAQGNGKALTAATNQELAAARSATAKYHDIAQAEADGYVNIDLYEPGEGFHWLNAALLDNTFDPAKPEILLYAEVPGETHLKLVAVEYLVPLAAGRPAGFIGPADVWREDTERFGLWELTVWLWEHNPTGMFAHLNPRVP